MLKDMDKVVITKWNVYNRKWYESLGYTFKRVNEELLVPIKNLYSGSKVDVDVICDYCGKMYTSSYYSIINGRKSFPKDACKNCASKKSSDVNRLARSSKAFKALHEVCEKHGYTLLTKEKEYVDKRMKIKYICPKHGVQECYIDNLVRGHRCFKCSYETRFDSTMISVDQVEDTITSFGDTWVNKDEYINSTTNNLVIKCKCGNTYKVSYQVFVNKNQTVCPVCSNKESVGERKIRRFLEEQGIEYEQEKRFPNCKDKKSLPFDFYIPCINTCIEFDGQHHFNPVRGIDNFVTTQRHDKIKTAYCKQAGINLIRIPYTSGNKINEILMNELNI